MIDHIVPHMEIRFTFEDFEPYFKKNGIDTRTLTLDEWRSFENMFMEGTCWSEVADEAAWNILQERNRLEYLGS